jgi:hypothetical protein
MRFLLPLFLLAFSASASEIWTCSIDATLTGDAAFYLRYGRDAWNGRATMNCTAREGMASKVVEISYNGSAPGFGANASSKLTLHVDLKTESAPSDFQLYSYVYNSRPMESETVWASDSGGIVLEAKVSGEAAVRNSLQQGNLFIR